MQFYKYQKEAMKLLILEKNKDKLIARVTLGIAGESGEVAEKVKKYLRKDYSKTILKNIISKEIGDVLFYLAVLSEILQLNLENIAIENIDKLKKRRKKGKLRGNGDER